MKGRIVRPELGGSIADLPEIGRLHIGKKSDKGYAAASESRLMEYAQKVYSQFAAKPDEEWLNDISSELSLPELLSQLEKAVNDRMTEV